MAVLEQECQRTAQYPLVSSASSNRLAHIFRLSQEGSALVEDLVASQTHGDVVAALEGKHLTNGLNGRVVEAAIARACRNYHAEIAQSDPYGDVVLGYDFCIRGKLFAQIKMLYEIPEGVGIKVFTDPIAMQKYLVDLFAWQIAELMAGCSRYHKRMNVSDYRFPDEDLYPWIYNGLTSRVYNPQGGNAYWDHLARFFRGTEINGWFTRVSRILRFVPKFHKLKATLGNVPSAFILVNPDSIDYGDTLDFDPQRTSGLQELYAFCDG